MKTKHLHDRQVRFKELAHVLLFTTEKEITTAGVTKL